MKKNRSAKVNMGFRRSHSKGQKPQERYKFSPSRILIKRFQ
ncbi:hypothetical protein [Bartonella doshiae]|nr:hypothetical protein [Bartonella doshiae]MBB6158943.1 hypothetical protein [Bartonella doshiae]